MEFKRNIRKFGPDSLGIVIPKDLVDYLEFKEGEEIIIKEFEGKKGKFVAFWKR